MFVIRHRKIFYVFSALIVTASFAALLIWGLKLGIDFTGGAILELRFIEERPDSDLLRQRATSAGFSGAMFQLSGEGEALVRLPDISEDEHQKLLRAISGDSEPDNVEELRFDSIGPIIGQELKRKSFIAILLVLAMILAFVSWSFRKVSRPVASWKYGLVAIVALAHDVIIPVGFFVVLGRFAGAEVGMLFVTALLTILGFSVHDTIVVFDRIRENIGRFGATMPFEEIVGKSLNEVMGRSLATSFVLFLVLVSLFLLGESSIKYFVLTLLIGVIAGTYSSVFLASPLIVNLEKLNKKIRA